LEKTPDRGRRYAILGDWYVHKKKDYVSAIRAYEEALIRNPDSAYVLNNLAWIYATCDDRLLRNPEKANRLALKAVRLKPASHILDTLAESFFINGMVDDAIQTARLALAETTDNHSYFEKQLNRFIANQDELFRKPN
jgi:tetratricopeptide (TPR) repeat protein